MNAWEAKEYGIVDGVIDDGKPGLVAPIGEIKEPPKTKVWEYWTVKDLKERKVLRTETSILNEKSEIDEASKEAGGKEQAAA
jgi:ATP-dependent Clp protease protease subunit